MSLEVGKRLLDATGSCWRLSRLLEVGKCCRRVLEIVRAWGRWKFIELVGDYWRWLEVDRYYWRSGWRLVDIIGGGWRLLEVGSCWMLVEVGRSCYCRGYWMLLDIRRDQNLENSVFFKKTQGSRILSPEAVTQLIRKLFIHT